MDFQALIASIPENQRDAFIECLEMAWKGLWLPGVDPVSSEMAASDADTGKTLGYRTMEAARDYAESADEEGFTDWMDENI